MTLRPASLNAERPVQLAGVESSAHVLEGHPRRVQPGRPLRESSPRTRRPRVATRRLDEGDLGRRDRHAIYEEFDLVADLHVDAKLDLALDGLAVGGRDAFDRVGQAEFGAAGHRYNGKDHYQRQRYAEHEKSDAVPSRAHVVMLRGRPIGEVMDDYRCVVRLNPVLSGLGAYPIATIHERARALRDAGKTVIDFSIGDPREPTPAFIPDALRAAVPEVSQYPLTAGMPELRAAVADYLQRRFDVVVDPDTQVMPTSGSKEAVFNTPLAFVDREAGDTVVFPTPGYPIYERGALFAGAVTHPVVLHGDFVMRADDIPDAAWAAARLVWTCSPHNPTGSVTTASELGDLVSRSRDSGALLLSDECYADVYEEDAFPDPPASVLQLAGDGSEGVLAYFSCSKRSGMTGYRSGAIVGDADAIGALGRLRTSTGTASPDFVQAAAIAAWSDDAHAAERREIFARKRKILRTAFDQIGVHTVASRAGLYIWVEVGDDLGASSRLLEGGVVVSPGRFFGPGGEGHLRLALIPTVAECEAAVEVVQKWLT